jgi:hypothetical protein
MSEVHECAPPCSRDIGNPIRGNISRPDNLLHPITMSGSPTTFGRSMRLHLDDVRFDEPCATRPGFCADESISRRSLDQNFFVDTSSKFSIRQLTSHHHGASRDTHAIETSAHLSTQNLEPAEAVSRSPIRKHEAEAPQLDSFLRQPVGILIGVGDKVGRHRSVSPTRKVSVALSTPQDRPKSPMRHRSVSPMRRRWTASSAHDPSSKVVEAPVMEREHTVYTAQVATALTTGKPVWL